MKKPITTHIMLILFATCIMTACAHKSEQWYKEGATQQDFYITRQHCDSEVMAGPARASFVGTMLQQSYIFDSCMENNGYVKVDATKVVTPVQAATRPASADIISDNPDLKMAYCFGKTAASAEFADKTAQNVSDEKEQKLPGTRKVWQAEANALKRNADSFRNYLTTKGLYSTDPNQTPQPILQEIATGGQEGTEVFTEMMQKKGPLMCQKACPDYNPSYPAQHDACVQACGPLTLKEQRVMACPDKP